MQTNGRACGACASWSRGRSSRRKKENQGPAGYLVGGGRLRFVAPAASSQARTSRQMQPVECSSEHRSTGCTRAPPESLHVQRHQHDKRPAVGHDHAQPHEEALRPAAGLRRTGMSKQRLRIPKQQPVYVHSVNPPPHSTSLIRKPAPSKQSLLRPWTEKVVTLPPRICGRCSLHCVPPAPFDEAHAVDFRDN